MCRAAASPPTPGRSHVITFSHADADEHPGEGFCVRCEQWMNIVEYLQTMCEAALACQPPSTHVWLHGEARCYCGERGEP